MKTLSGAYDAIALALTESLCQAGIQADAVQRQALVALARVAQPSAAGWRQLLRRHAHQGIYLWGAPGRGKTLLMDHFYSLAAGNKRRVHFHEFLRHMHQELARVSAYQQPFSSAVDAYCDGLDLLCFDEFHVHDIADAVLISKLLDALIKRDMRIVLTSNYAPQRLMPDPVSHARFAPAIQLLQKHFNIVHLDGVEDYRAQSLVQAQHYLYPLNETTTAALQSYFLRLEPSASLEPAHVEVAGRWLPCIALGEKTLWLDFDALCRANRSYIDYLELAERFEVFLVSSITAYSLDNANTLKRFLWLVDVLYDKKKSLLLSSEEPIRQMLGACESIADLERTSSRLAEMERLASQQMSISA